MSSPDPIDPEPTVPDPDRIERQIEIEAPAEMVWQLVSEPGWWINDGELVEHRIEQRSDHVVVHDPTHGAFPLRLVAEDAPHYVAFRWMGQDGSDDGTSLVEFRITPVTGGVLLAVVESGLASIPGSAERRRAVYRDNVDGWETELAAARHHLDFRRVEVARWVDASPEQVWPFLSTAGGLRRWYAFDGVEGEVRAGVTLRLSWHEHGTFLARVESVERSTGLTLRLAVQPGCEPAPGSSTLVTVSARADGGGSVVVVEQREIDQLQARWGDHAEFAARERDAWRAGVQLLSEAVAGPGTL